MLRVGIDLGGTKIEGIALRGSGEVARLRMDTPRGDYAATLDAIAAAVATLEQRAGSHGRIGIGIPGTLSAGTGLVKNANSVWLIGKPLLEDLRTRLGRDVRIANDANCFAVSEAADGAAAGADVVFGVIIGTGTGAGIVIRGEVLTGLHGIAGEWGHNPLPWPDDEERPGPACYCGRRGCIETFLSGPGMSGDHALRTGRRETPPDIEAAAAGGDAQAEATLQRYESRMARGLATVINVLDPDVIVLGGGMSNIERLYDAVPRLWSEHVFACGASRDGSPDRPHPIAAHGEAARTRLVRARHGDSSGVRGAAWLWPAD
jgi:fructokinase